MVSFQLILSVLPDYCFGFLCIAFNESYLTCMTRCHGSLARILYTLFYLKILFFCTFLHLKTKNQKLIDVMKTVAADIDFQQLSCEMSLMYYLSGSMIC